MADPRTYGTLDDNRQTGIYRIRCTETGKVYVGSASKSFDSRWQLHRLHLNRGTHHSRHLQRAWLKYGPLYFAFEIVERTQPEHAVAVEQTFIDFWKSSDPKHGYNGSPTAGSVLGIKRSAETRAKLSAANRRRPMTPEVLARLAELNRNRGPVSDETRRKMSEVKRGKTPTPETREKLVAANTGRKHTPETCDKMSAAQRNRSPEVNAKISAANRGKKRSPESIAKSAAAMRGQKRSPELVARLADRLRGRPRSTETKAKVSAGLKAYFQQLRDDGVVLPKRKHTAESIAKMSASKRGVKPSPEAIKKSAAANRGRKASSATKAKQAAARKLWWKRHREGKDVGSHG